MYMYTQKTLQQTYTRLLSRSNFMRTQKPICAGVIVSISNLILRYLGVREWRIHTHYHLTFQSCSRNRGNRCVAYLFPVLPGNPPWPEKEGVVRRLCARVPRTKVARCVCVCDSFLTLRVSSFAYTRENLRKTLFARIVR